MINRLHLLRSSLFASWICMAIMTIAPMTVGYAQGPYCVDKNCTANDIQDPSYFLGDVNGTPLTSISCTPGSNVTDVYLWIAFTVTATNRYEVNVVGDILVDGTYDASFDVCLGDFGSGTYVELIGQIVWECGAELVIANTLFAWSNQEQGDNPDVCMQCPDVPSKCDRFGDITVAAPIVADFSYTSECLPGSQYEVFTFVDETTGGALPYANYTWDFGAGATPTPSTTSGPGASGPFTVEYDSPGMRTVSLTVTDDGGISSEVSYVIDVQESPVASVIVDDQEICDGGSAALMAMVSSGGPFGYQWQQLIGGVWTNVGTDSPNFNTGPLSIGSYQYRVIVDQNGGCSSTSDPVTVTVVGDPTVTVTAQSDSICDGGMAVLTANVTGGTGTTSYQWQQFIGGVWTNVGTDSPMYTSPALGIGTYQYRVIVNQDAGCNDTSDGVTVTVVNDPTVGVSAQADTICDGGIAFLSATVSGGAGNVTYQWQQFVGGVWTNVGSNQATYTTSPLAVGEYLFRVLISQNSGCSATSATATISVIGDPTVSVVADADSICDGGSALLTAVISGGAGTPSFQWQQFVGGVWVNIGSNQATYSTGALDIGTYQYRVLLTQNSGCEDTSDGQTITVVGDPTVDVTADDLTICDGGTVTLTANVSGGAGNVNYQWQRFVGGVWTNVGANQPNYTTPALSIGTHQFRVQISQNSGCNATSATVNVMVVSDPTVSIQAEADSICDGGMAVLMAIVSGGAGTSSFQWQQFVGGVWTNVGTDQDTYTTGALSQGTYQFRVLLAQNSGCEASSATQNITVVGDPTVDVTADDFSICDGGTVTLTANVNGGAGPVTYQWQQFIGGVWTNIGSDQPTYTTPVLGTGTYQYRVLTSQNSGCNATSATATVIVVDDPTVSVSAEADSICDGGMAILTATPSGGTGDNHYQWQQFIGGVWTNVGSDQNTYTSGGLTPGTYNFRVLLTQDAGCDAASATYTITVVDDPEITVTSDEFGVCEGETVTLTANVTGGAGTVSYQWQQFVGGVWVNVGSDQNTYTTPALPIGDYQFRVQVSQNNGCFATSATADVTIADDPTVEIIAVADSICDGGMAELTAVVTGGAGPASYQWQEFVGGVWVNVGTDQDTYTSPALGLGSYIYRVLVTQNSGCDGASASTTITVVDDPEVEVTTESTIICVGNAATFTAVVTGGAGGANYQWQQFIAGVWVNIGTNQATYSTAPLNLIDDYEFRVIVTQNSGCSVTSATLVVTVVEGPSVSVTADENSICDGGVAVLTATVTGGSQNPSYQWQQLINSIWTDVGADQPTYTSDTLSPGIYNFRVILEQAGGCEANSAPAVITVEEDPDVLVLADDATICEGGSAMLTAVVNGGAGTSNYQWQQFVGGVWVNVGTNSYQFTSAPLAIGSYQYRVIVTQNSGCETTSDEVAITVVGDPTVTVSADANSICVGGMAVLTATVSGGSGTSSYQWQLFNSGIWTPVGTNSPTYTTAALPVGSFQYRVIVTQDEGCNATSAATTITVVNDPTVSVSADDASICEGGTATITATINGGAGPATYQWQQLVSGLWVNVGGNTPMYTTPPLSIGTYTYRVQITQNSGCSATSAQSVITVVGDPTVELQADQTNICEGGTVSFTAIVSGGTGTTHYQWQQLVSGSWTNVGLDQSTYTTPPLAVGSYNFRVLVSQDAGCNVTSSSQGVTVTSDPDVSVNTSGNDICVGGTVTMTANVTGGVGTTNYQWQQFISGSWVNVGTNQNSYTTPELNTIGTYTYRVMITQNNGCSDTSGDIVVNVVGDPTVSVSAEETDICDGGQAVLTATVMGGTGPITYQWQRFVSGAWQNVGGNSNMYTTPTLFVGLGPYQYRVIINQNSGCTATSASLTINVEDDPVIDVETGDTEICEGATATFTANVTGGAGSNTYQWQQFVGGVWVNVGTNQDTYTTPALGLGMYFYRVVVTQNSGCSTTSDQVVVNVVSGPSVSISADANEICTGGMATLTATVTGGAGPVNYQWQLFSGGMWVNVGTNQDTYTTPALTAGSYQYRVMIDQNAGCFATSATEVITVVSDPTVTVSADDASICDGGTVTFTANVSGGAGTSNFQWQQFVGGTWTNVGSNMNTYTTSPLSVGTHQFRVIVTQNSGCSTTSASSTVTVVGDPSVSLSVDANTICIGGSANLTATVTGGTGPANYQWQEFVSGSWVDVGSNQPTFNTGILSSAGVYEYRVIVTQDAGCNATSATQAILVVNDPTVSVTSDNAEICEGGIVTLTATVSGGAGPISYQWQQFVSGVWVNVGPNQSTYTTVPLAIGTYQFRVLITQNSGCSATSATSTVTVVGDPTVSIVPDEATICTGGTAFLTAVVNGGTGSPDFQWQQFISGVWTNVGSNQDTYMTGVLMTGSYQFRVILTQVSGCEATSATQTISVVADPGVSVSADVDSICEGGMVTLTASVTGGAGTSNYQWQAFQGGVWVNVGSNQNTYTTPVLNTSGTYEYQVIVTQNSGCETTSAVFEVEVTGDPTVTVSADANSICEGGSATLTATVTGGAGPTSYQWQAFLSGVWTNVGSDQNTYTTPVLNVTGVYYYRVIVNQNSGCTTTSANEEITVVTDPTVTVDIGDDEICAGGMVTLTANVNGGAGTVNYQWQRFVGGVWVNVGTNQATYTTVALAIGTHSYRVQITQNSGCSATSATAVITVVGDPEATVTADANTICDGGMATLTATVTGGTGMNHYQWQAFIGGVWVDVGTDQNTYTTPVLNTGSYDYRVEVTQDAGCLDLSPTITITVNDDPDVSISASDDEICDGDNTVLTATVTGGAGTSSFQWQYFTGGMWTNVGTNQNTYTTPALSAGTHLYRVQVTQNSGCFTTSGDFTVTVNANPDANADPGQEICLGDSVEIGVSPSGGTGPYTFEWSNGAMTQTITVSPGVTTIYFVTVYDANLCASAEDFVQVTVNPNPVANAGLDQTICLTESATLSASGGTSYAWSTGENTQSIEVTPDTTTTYTVTVTDANGCTDTDQVQVSVNPCQGVISGYVRDDLGNPIGGVTIELYADTDMDGNADGPVLNTAVSEAETGLYIFEDVEPDDYVLVEIQPANYDDVSDYDHTPDPDGDDQAQGADNDIPVTLEPFEGDLDNNFTEDPHVGNISGLVEDEYGSPIQGVTIQLYGDANQDGEEDGPVIATEMTDAMGEYAFTGVEPGYYVVVEVQPANYTSVSDYDVTPDPDGDDQAQGADNDVPVVLMPGESDEDNNFFEDANIGIICGSVSDTLGNPISNVTIELYADTNGDGNPDGAALLTTVTDGETGLYCFEDVEYGEYVIVEIQPPNYNSVSDYDHTPDPDGDDSAQGTDDNIPVILDPGEADLDNNFIEAAFLGSISGYVRDEFDQGIPDVTLQLFNDFDEDGSPDGPAIATQMTDANGDYLFDGVVVGSYLVIQTQPAGYTSVSDYDHTPDPDGDDQAQGPDNDIPVVVSAAEDDEDNNFIEDANVGIICGSVTDDLGNPISNVTLNLYADTDGDGNPDGGILYTTTSDGETGLYCFEDIEYGEYVIVEIQPANYDDVSDYDHTPDPDGDDQAQGPDNDIPVVLEPAEADLDNNFIEDPFTGVISGNVRDLLAQPIEDVTIELFNDFDNDGNADGAAIASTMTDAMGDYAFSGVEPGIYVVVETQPTGFLSDSDIDLSVGPMDMDGDDGPVADNDIPVIVLPGESDEDNDFIENGLPGIICGTVEDDTGNPLSNVMLELYADTNGDGNPDGGVITTTTTDGETGLYCFEDVPYGTYVVVEIQPANYDDVSDYDHTPDPDGDDSADGPDNDIPVVLEAGEADLDNNFIEDPNPGSISGNVSETGPAPIEGVTIELHSDPDGDGIPDMGPIATDVTDASGNYSFDGVEPGGYVLIEVQPAGYIDVFDYDETPDPDGDDSGQGADNDIPVIVQAGESDEDNNFFEEGLPGVICGSVMDDEGNPLSNVTIELYADTDGDGNPDGAPIATTTTDGETGAYCFEDVVHGTYVVVEIQPNNYDSVYDYDETPDPDGDDSGEGPDDNIPVVLEPAEADLDNNFVEDPNVGDITGQVREDTGNPISGVTISLFNDFDGDGTPDGPAIATDVSDGNGDYAFNGVEPAAYVLVETQPANHFNVSDVDGTPDPDGDDGPIADNDIPVVLDPGEVDADNDFVEDPYPGVICGSVLDDQGNPLSNVELQLYADADGNGVPDGAVLQTVFTDGETGLYCFEDVEYGTYLVVEIQPANYESVSDYDATPDPDGDDSGLGPNDQIPVVLEAGEADLDNNFIEDPNTGQISGNVSEDTGVPLANVQLDLFNDINGDGNPDGASIGNVMTDAGGDYLFDGVEAGNYVVVQMQPANYFSVSDVDATPDPDGDDGPTPDNDIPVILDPGEVDADNDFVEDPYPGIICGTVMDNSGNPLSNVELQLYADSDGNGVADGPILQTQFTDGETGSYCFEDVEYGDYVVVEIQPVNYDDVSDYDATPDPDGDDSAQGPDNDIPVVVEPGEADLDNNFVEEPFEGTISGNVSEDTGVPLQGITIEFYSDPEGDGVPNGAPLATDMTDASGNYSFGGITPGSYLLVEIQPANYFDVSDYDETPDPDGDDSGLGPNNQIPVVMAPGEADDDNNFVEDPYPGVICGSVFDDDDNPLSNVTLNLYADTNGDGMPDGGILATTTSDGETGAYCFEDVEYGTYVVVEIQPTNYTSVSDYDATPDPDGDDSGLGPNDKIPVVLEVGEADLDNNFVESPNPGTISGNVREDTGVPLQDVTIELFLDLNGDGNPDGTAIASVMTDAAGDYTFTGAEAGAYVVVETQPANYYSVSDVDATPDPDGDDSGQGPDNDIPVVVSPGEDDLDNDFIEDPYPGIICGEVTDELGNPLSNVELQLYADTDGDGVADGGILATTTSDGETGSYCFEDVEYGDYVIVQVQPTGYESQSDYDLSTGMSDPDGDDSGQGPDNDIPVTIVPGEADFDNNFVEIACPGLPEIEGQDTFYICDGASVIINAVMQPINGATYTWDFGDGATPPSGVGTGPHEVFYAHTDNNQNNGAAVILTISKPGCPVQTGEVARVFVSLIADATIDAPVFDLCQGLPRVFEPLADEIPGAIYTWDFGLGASPSSATGYGPHSVVYSSNGLKTVTLIVDPNYPVLASCPDTSEIQFEVVTCLSNISGIVRTNDVPPVPISSVLISLYADNNTDGLPDDPNNPDEVTLTSSQGQYSFNNIMAGNYVIQEFQPAGYESMRDYDNSEDFDLVPNLDILDDLIPVTLIPGESDFGNFFIESNTHGSISGTVYEDIDEDGVLDAGEGIAGVTVRLYEDNDQNGEPDGAAIDSVTTNLVGNYIFELVMSGDYVVEEVQPDGYADVEDIDPTDDGDNVMNTNMMDDLIPATVDPVEADADNDFKDINTCSLLVTSLDDDGAGTLRAAIACAADGDTITFHFSLGGQTIILTSEDLEINKDIVIINELVSSITVKSEVMGAFEIKAGAEAEIHNLKIIGGPTGNPAALLNSGTLLLNDVLIQPHPTFDINGGTLVRNEFLLNIQGNTMILNE